MSLNGNLEVFPLEEVLRLLARSRKSGCLRVESGGIQGRVFLKDGSMTLATVAGDDELRRRLVAAGIVDEADLRKVELSGSPVSDVLAADVTPAALSEFVREESVEGLYRIRRSGRGNFDFLMDLAPRYPSGQSYDSEVIVSEADRRALEWQDVESVLPSMDTVVRMVSVLDGEESVTLSPSTWRILAALGAGTSAASVGRTIGWSDFRAAREIASLLRAGLVATVDGAVASPTPAHQTPVVEARTEPVIVAEPEPEPEPEPAVEAESAPEPVLVEAEPEPAVEPEPAPEPAFVEAEAVVAAEVETPVVEEEPSFFEAAAAEPEASVEPEVVADPVAAFEGWTTEPVQAEASTVDEAVAAEDAADDPASWWSDTPVVREVSVEDDFAAAEDTVPQTEPSPTAPWGSNPWTAEIPTEEPEAQANPWGGWAGTTSDASAEAEAALEPLEVAAEPEPVAGASDDHSGGWWAQTMGAAETEAKPADNDADRFLESVFSSLSEESESRPGKEEDEDETGFGMGLLRRRRMGAAARDIDNDR